MASYTITTTDDQDAALAYSFEKAKPGNPPGLDPLPVDMTQEQYLQKVMDETVFPQMSGAYTAALDKRLRGSLNTIPAEQSSVAAQEIADVIAKHGGQVLEVPGLPSPDGGDFVLRR